MTRVSNTPQPAGIVLSDESDCLVRIRRPDGKETILRIPGEHWERVMQLVQGEFGDKSIDLGGPRLPEKE